jgi:hypothetical protein
VDPGTGAYYANSRLRNWLASRAAHNGPAPAVGEALRRGPFLWAEHHAMPRIVAGQHGGAAMELDLVGTCIRRRISRLPSEDGWLVEDELVDGGPLPEFVVLWQFAPETICREIEPRRFTIARHGTAMEVRVNAAWEAADLTAEPPGTAEALPGTVSPHFRQTAWAPFLRLVARPQGNESCVFQTVFLASNH